MKSIYSVDKVKLEYRYIKTGRVNSFLKSLESYTNVSYSLSNKIVNCQHNFYFGEKGSEGVVYVGVVPNWKPENKDDKSIVLEYNPNKVDPMLISSLAWLRNISKYNIRLMSCDFAVDFNVDYNTVRMLKRDKRESMGMWGHSDIETRYLGSLGHGHIKLYDKAKEQKLDVPWTRFEITNKKINSLSCNFEEFDELINFPSVYTIGCQIDIDQVLFNDTTRLCFEAIINNIDLLYTIKNYNTRKKYEKLLNQVLSDLPINKRSMYNSYLEFCNKFNQACDCKCVHTDFQSMLYDQASLWQ